MKILLDTNVILDVALKREPFYQAAAAVFKASDSNDWRLFITASIATDLYYVLRKEKGRDIAWQFIVQLLECVDVCLVNKPILEKALTSGFADFEDAVQNAAADHEGMDIILTRNKADFSMSALPILTPADFVSAHLE